MLKSILLVGLGGGTGSIFRFLASHFTRKYFSGNFPLATFLVNLSGCLLIGLFIGWMIKSQNFSTDLKWLLIVGFCGGYTTFSAFALENFELIQSEKYVMAILYILGSVILGILSVWLGIFLSKLI